MIGTSLGGVTDVIPPCILLAVLVRSKLLGIGNVQLFIRGPIRYYGRSACSTDFPKISRQRVLMLSNSGHVRNERLLKLVEVQKCILSTCNGGL